MTSRTFDPGTVQLRNDITVTRVKGATVIANLPRNLEDFRQDEDHSLVGSLKSWWKGLTNQRELYPSAQAA
ncbi:hypothetical protein CDES_13440 [Corynebacterium deserti GIMN1.010]|uniref:Uncharacterized protein n=1 Tax=Corynebacterium deserti GIMN1.010 TaxID=931089 RepID=A0A0M5IGN9_9CORY|nr:hypothetical protein [Corynebacterium deserti]ALC07018.1 hypothetical protein CDES_13440 [Corynebacterium deserti GIMN1.010]